MTRRRRIARFLERALLGTVMSVIAFVIERRVLKAIRKGTTKKFVEEPQRTELTPTAAG